MERIQSFGPDYFNDQLLTKLGDVALVTTPFDETGLDRLSFNEKGERESMSVYDFLDRGEGIANALKGRARAFLFRMDLSEDYLGHHIDMAKSLLVQF